MSANRFWTILLIARLVVVIIGVDAYNNLDFSISGDGIPNRTQQGPSKDYPWGQVLSIVGVVGTAAIVTLYSFYKIAHKPLKLIH